MREKDDLIEFEAEGQAPGPADFLAWKILVVDDERDVHQVTRLALQDFRFEGQTLELISAYSGTEAQDIMAVRDDIALILLDVVMETEHAGLDAVRHIRKTLKNPFVRIVLRTGQPGSAPERKVITEYDINDYKAKGELTASKLFTVIHTGLSSYRDLRELQQIRLMLARRTQELAGANEDMERYAGKVAADLQHALRGIAGLVGMFTRRYGETEGEERMWARNLNVYLRQAQETVSGLKDYTAQVGGSTDRQSVEVGSVLNLATLNLKQKIEEAKAVVLHGDLPTIHVQSGDLLRLFQNLIDNAIKFRGEREPRIMVSAERKEGRWVFSISDNGQGMAGQRCERLFSQAGPADPVVSKHDTGKGLAICKRIVERQGGKIWASSEPGAGCRVSFTLSP